MKVGILTLFHRNYNWGGVLQGYALKTYLENEYRDMQADILQYHSEKNIVYPTKLKQAVQYTPSEIFEKISYKLKKKNNLAIDDKIAVRKKLFQKFMSEYTTNETIYDDSNLILAAKDYDCLICGSDQIWSPNVSRPGYFLEQVKDECTKISYAASIARSGLSKNEQKVMLPLIKQFDFISVREKTAKDFLDKYYGGQVKINEVLDPALMLTSSQWHEISNLKNTDNEPYALAFFFSESYEYRQRIEKYCCKNGLKLKFIPFAKNEYIPTDLSGNSELVFDAGPGEFINLFENAECIFTDSFHGAVFSIIFNKPFCIFERDKNTKVSKNSRLYDLLDKFSLSKRLIKDNIDIDKIMKEKIDFESVNLKLEYYRKDSKKYLDTAFCNVKCKEQKK